LEASFFQTDAVGWPFAPVLFEQSYQTKPVIISSVASFNENDTVVGRIRNIDLEGFEYCMDEQEANSRYHAEEMIAYIAWQPSSGSLNGFLFEVGRTANQVDENFSTIDFQQRYTIAPVFLADMQTCNGGDTASLRWRNKDAYSVQVQVDEEASANSEVSHANETVGYIVLE
jgi:hypothetical protein